MRAIVDKNPDSLQRKVTGNRRGVALSSLQGIWRHTTVHAKCRLYGPDDPKVSSRFSAKDTSVASKDGVGIHLNGHQREAWHMGKPLFRCAEEWCDTTATAAEGATRQPQISESASERRFGLEIGMLVRIKSSNANAKGDCFAEVQGFSQTEQSVKLGCIAQSGSNKLRSEWFPLDCLLLPDYSELHEGLQLQVKDIVSDKKQFYCKVLQVSKEKKHSRAPVLVHYPGYTSDSDEWVGADRLRSKFIKFVPPNPEVSLDQPSGSSEVHSRAKAAARVDGPTLPSLSATSTLKCATSTADFGNSTLVCITSDDGKQRFGVVSESSEAEEKVKVSYKEVWASSKRADEWIPIAGLQIPDYSGIEKASQVQVVEESGSKQWDCKALEVSQCKKRARAPVKVHYTGYTSKDDEWVGADRLRSKRLKFLPWLPWNASASSAERAQEDVFDSAHDLSERVDAHLHGSLVYAKTKNGLEPGEILEVSQDTARAAMPVKVRLSRAGGARWFSGDSLQIPDYSSIRKGLKAAVSLTGESFRNCIDCTVLEVSHSKERQLAPVLVHYTGHRSKDDEWVGADRFRSKQLKFLPWLPWNASASSAERAQEDAFDSAHDLSERVDAHLQGTLVYAKTKNGLEPCEILEVSQDTARAAMPVKVRLSRAGGARWFSGDSLQIPDYSSVRKGLKAAVSLTGESFRNCIDCTVLEVSHSKERQLAPVLVHYTGHRSKDDEWVGADRFRSKQLKFLDLKSHPKMKLVAGNQLPMPKEIEDHAPVTTESPLPWNEPDRTDADADGFDLAIKAVQLALHGEEAIDKRQTNLESTLAAGPPQRLFWIEFAITSTARNVLSMLYVFYCRQRARVGIDSEIAHDLIIFFRSFRQDGQSQYIICCFLLSQGKDSDRRTSFVVRSAWMDWHSIFSET